MSYDSRALHEIPSVISPEDRDTLMLATTLNLQSSVLLYEEMMERYSDLRYSDLHPFLLVRLADMFVLLGSRALAVDLYCKAQSILSSMGIIDKGLEALVQQYATQVDEQVNVALVRSRQSSYSQTWKPTKQHAFPTNLPHLPPGSEELKDQWQALTSAGAESAFFAAAYLTKLAIETNQVEGGFLLTEDSIQDLVRRGISEGTVDYLPDSALKDPAKIKTILSDAVAACELVDALVANVDSGLDKSAICCIHARLMKTCRFISDLHYLPAGKTRTETRTTVIISGTYRIECCPFPEVDAEVEYICRMAKQWIKSWQNPFATASWIHLVLVRCHPFEDGNGRLVRLLASIPLLKHGYPPISVTSTQCADYYAAIQKAYEGDHSALVQCMLQGMQETVTSVQSL